MNTKQKNAMMDYVEANAQGENFRKKLTEAVKFGFNLREQEIEEWRKLTAMQAAAELDEAKK